MDSSIADELLKLINLKTLGAITEDEFLVLKSRAINNLSPTPSMPILQPSNKRNRTLHDCGLMPKRPRLEVVLKCTGCSKTFATTQARGSHMKFCKQVPTTKSVIESFLRPLEDCQDKENTPVPIIHLGIDTQSPPPRSKVVTNQAQPRRRFSVSQKVALEVKSLF